MFSFYASVNVFERNNKSVSVKSRTRTFLRVRKVRSEKLRPKNNTYKFYAQKHYAQKNYALTVYLLRIYALVNKIITRYVLYSYANLYYALLLLVLQYSALIIQCHILYVRCGKRQYGLKWKKTNHSLYSEQQQYVSREKCERCDYVRAE